MMVGLSWSRRISYALRHDFTLPTPPVEFIESVGGGDFHAVGEHFMMIFQDHCDLASDATVLDIGSGCGRIAIPLTRYLLPTAQYHGIEIVLPMLEWCRQNITSKCPNFQFHHASLRNTLYSQIGDNAGGYRFPFDDNKFDFAFATSVFTHLNPKSVKQYITEMHRVLKPDGTALTTWFLLNRDNIAWGASYANGICRVAIPESPEAITAYEEQYVFQLLREVGLKIDGISYGSWTGRKGLSLQDLILTSKVL
jgi:ubiquinone/menaquinone biosynthesis C-methylase UbiE